MDSPDSGSSSCPTGSSPFLSTGDGGSGSPHELAGGDTSTHSDVDPGPDVTPVLLVGLSPRGSGPGSTHSDVGPDTDVTLVLLVGLSPGGSGPGSTNSDMDPGSDMTPVLLVGPGNSAPVSGSSTASAELGSSFRGLTGSSLPPAGRLLPLLFSLLPGEQRYHGNQ